MHSVLAYYYCNFVALQPSSSCICVLASRSERLFCGAAILPTGRACNKGPSIVVLHAEVPIVGAERLYQPATRFFFLYSPADS